MHIFYLKYPTFVIFFNIDDLLKKIFVEMLNLRLVDWRTDWFQYYAEDCSPDAISQAPPDHLKSEDPAL